MTPGPPVPSPVPAAGACMSCRRRSWLLSELSGPLDYRARDRGRLFELLELADEELMKALAGRRAVELRALYEGFCEAVGAGDGDGEPSPGSEPASTCPHRDGYPTGLVGLGSAPMLHLAGNPERLRALTAGPVVAVLGSTMASDYGMELARTLARGLSVSGVTVAGGLTDGIAVAAHTGAFAGGGASVAVLGGGLDVACPSRRRALYANVMGRGCAVSELPHGCRGRRWGQLASERITVGLANVTVLIEAQDTPGELAGARLAQTLGRTLAATPGRIGSPLSQGPHALLMDGARLIRGPEDVLELLYDGGAGQAGPSQPGSTSAGHRRPLRLQPRLQAILGSVGCGRDTPDKLTESGIDPGEVLLALSELELLGLLARGDGGRYLPRDPALGWLPADRQDIDVRPRPLDGRRRPRGRPGNIQQKPRKSGGYA